jgi:hypothetical protein
VSTLTPIPIPEMFDGVVIRLRQVTGRLAPELGMGRPIKSQEGAAAAVAVAG